MERGILRLVAPPFWPFLRCLQLNKSSYFFSSRCHDSDLDSQSDKSARQKKGDKFQEYVEKKLTNELSLAVEHPISGADFILINHDNIAAKTFHKGTLLLAGRAIICRSSGGIK